MIPVYQTIVAKGDGDCHRAAVASILDLTIEQVPHFRRFERGWIGIYIAFMQAMGYDFAGTGRLAVRRDKIAEDAVFPGGLILAAVPSRTFADVRHQVVITPDGLVVHDPNPNQLWAGVDLFAENVDFTWDLFDKMETRC